MNARDDCLMNLMHILGWDDAATTFHNKLESVHHDHNNWHRQAEKAEKALAVSEQQETAAFEQARLLSMYIPPAHPEDTPGAGPSSRPLEERLIERWWSAQGLACRKERVGDL